MKVKTENEFSMLLMQENATEHFKNKQALTRHWV